MKQIRVLHVVGRMDRGGIETFIMNIYRNIDRSKIQFDFLCHYGTVGEYNDEIIKLGGKIYEMPVIKSTKKTYYFRLFKYVSALKKFFKEHDEYNIIHGHMTNTASIYMPIAKKSGVKTLIVHSHMSRSPKGLRGIITTILQIPLKYIATNYFACSLSAAKWIFSDKMIIEKKVKIINNSIDSNAFSFNQIIRNNYRKKFNIEEKFVIGHVGRFYIEKNHKFIISTFIEYLKFDENARLLLVGDGELLNSIKNNIKVNGIEDKVILLGSRDDVNKLMQAMDIFIMPSLFEGLPLVGVEAQCTGLKCFLSNVITNEINITGNVHFIDLKNGPKFWAEFIYNKKDYIRKSQKDIIISHGFDLKNNVEFLENFYEKNN